MVSLEQRWILFSAAAGGRFKLKSRAVKCEGFIGFAFSAIVTQCSKSENAITFIFLSDGPLARLIARPMLPPRGRAPELLTTSYWMDLNTHTRCFSSQTTSTSSGIKLESSPCLFTPRVSVFKGFTGQEI